MMLDDAETRVISFVSPRNTDQQAAILQRIKILSLRRTKWGHVKIVILVAAGSSLLESLFLLITAGWGLFFPEAAYYALQFLPTLLMAEVGINQIFFRTVAQDHSQPQYEGIWTSLCRWQFLLHFLLVVGGFLLMVYFSLPRSLAVSIGCIIFVNYLLAFVFALYAMCVVR